MQPALGAPPNAPRRDPVSPNADQPARTRQAVRLGHRTRKPTPQQPEPSQPTNPNGADSATTRGFTRKWLIAGTLAGLGTLSVAIALAFSNRASTPTDQDTTAVETAKSSLPATVEPSNPPAHAPKPKPPDPPNDGDRLVQMNTFDAKRVAGMNISAPNDALQQKTRLTAEKLPLIDVLKRLAERHRVPIVIDGAALSDEGIPLKLPVSVKLQDVSLENGLTDLLSPLLLTHVVLEKSPQAIVVTSSVKAASAGFNSTLAGRLQKTGTAKPAKATPKKRKPAPAQSILAINRKAKALLAQKKYAEAIAQFTRVIRRNAKHRTAHFDRGIAYLELKKNRNALADFSAAIRINRRNAAAYTKRAIAYNRLGQRSKAVADRKTATRLKTQQKKKKK